LGCLPWLPLDLHARLLASLGIISSSNHKENKNQQGRNEVLAYGSLKMKFGAQKLGS
jgi:hypothetical protein